MKFSDYYLAPISRVVASFLGILSGLAIGLFMGWQIGVLVGAGVAILASVIVPLKVYLEERPYNRIKETIKEPLLLDRRVRFSFRGGSVGGYFLLTDHSMIFLSLEDGEHRLEYTRSDVKNVVIGEDMSIRVYLNDQQFIRMISGVIDEIGKVLAENGWCVTFSNGEN